MADLQADGRAVLTGLAGDSHAAASYKRRYMGSARPPCTQPFTSYSKNESPSAPKVTWLDVAAPVSAEM